MDDAARTRKTVLIAEDDPVSRRLLDAFLKKWGYDVLSAVDGIQALDILQKPNAPRLAILDWMTPNMEGPEVCKRIREHPEWPYTYIILLTARSDRTDILEGLGSGVDDYLTKPFDSQELRARMHVGERILDLQSSLIAAQEELRFRATHDILTGVPNRGVVLDAFDREYSRQAREGGSFGIVLLDVDHFKYVNDNYGHLAGDLVLKEIGRRMSDAIRPYDTLGRYGGEEFLVVAPAADEAGIVSLAERIRLAIEAEPVRTNSGLIAVTASCGAAVSAAGKPNEPHILMKMADEALYRAKDRGRNRTELAKELPVLSR